METTGVLYSMTDIFPSGKPFLRANVDTLFTRISTLPYRISLSAEELYLVLDEALSNAMEHGNNWDSSKQVHLTLWKDPHFLHVLIEDEGTGFDASNSGSEFEEGNKLSHRGRGLSLIRRFCTPLWKNAGRLIDLPIRLA